MSEHILVLTDQETHLLGALYTLGAMGALAVGLGPEAEKLFQESRKLSAQMLDITAVAEMQRALRNKILGLVEEAAKDAERDA